MPMLDRRQLEDIKDDRVGVSTVAGIGEAADLDTAEVDELESLLVTRTASTGRVEISEILMCAKCIGECKIF